ncbi:splicing factor 3A subunit 2 [Nephila pilipes]|uniref:Splicing factor 3A subunit 2 n=1 Tax=Nephila pilipes TaxID=299642 RepID=A0A8X6KCE0_NEPPI|nr:splicing factor 3A subunit 2 [Nephila pilipes]
MDFQHRAGGKTGTGGVASWSETNRDRRERLRQLALETIDLNKDPYFMKNHLGSYECKLCLTLHNNEGSYLAHTQGKKHQANLARRAAKEAKESPQQPAPAKPRVDIKKFVKIGRPGYRVTKQRDRESGQQSLLFQIDYPEIGEGIAPRHRFMSAYEQKVEPPDRRWQYLLFAAEPYETIAFKVPSREVDKSEGKFWVMWNKETKQFFLQFSFKVEPKIIKLPIPPNAPPGQPQSQRPNAPMQNVPPPPPPAPMMPPPPRPMGMPPPHPPPNSMPPNFPSMPPPHMSQFQHMQRPPPPPMNMNFVPPPPPMMRPPGHMPPSNMAPPPPPPPSSMAPPPPPSNMAPPPPPSSMAPPPPPTSMAPPPPPSSAPPPPPSGTVPLPKFTPPPPPPPPPVSQSNPAIPGNPPVPPRVDSPPVSPPSPMYSPPASPPPFE